MAEGVSASEPTSNSAHELATVGGLAEGDDQATVIGGNRSWRSEREGDEGEGDNAKNHGSSWGLRIETSVETKVQDKSRELPSQSRTRGCGWVRASAGE